MAAEVPVSVVLCEAMEYLSKLGANLRTRSENLKDKRINKDKLKNAHAVHKAASKVLLICELSKKSLEKVENCVQSVISRVDASQAPSNVGGKSQEKPKFYYFEYDTHKLRISKKISIKHYTSAKVVAKSMTISMHDNYPVYYDCKLKRLRVGTSDFKSRKLANIDFETNQGKSDSNQNEIVDVESDDAKTEMAENSSDVTKSTQNTAECTSTNSDRRKPLRIMSISDTEDDIVPLATKSSNSVSTEDSVSKLVSDENKSEDSSATTENNNVDHTESLVKEHRESHSGPEDGKVSTEESSKKKSTKGGPITIFFNRKNTVKKSKTNGQQKNSSQILPVDDTNSEEDFKSNKNKEAQKENKPASNEANCSSDNLEPIKRKRKNSNVSDSSSQINDDSTKNSEENNMQKELNDDSNDSNNSKPLIRCVNITKLLKPDAVPVKSDLFAGKQSDIREHFSKKGSAQVHSKEESKIYNLGNKESSKSMIIKNKSNWDSKLKEVKNFKLKKFSLNVERLPELSTKFLLDHNLIRIIQGGHTVCEVRKDEAKSDTYMKKVKNALLNDSESDDSVKAQSKRVKHSLLNDSDSDKEIGTNIDSQVVSQKEINPATIKDSLLCDSDSDKNEEQVVKENSKVSDGNTNNSQERIDTVVENIIASLSRLNEHSAQNQEKSDDSSLKSYVNKENDNHNVSETEKLNEPCHDTIKAKSSLLNDSDSDSEPFPRTKERFISARESSELKKMLLNHSSSSEHEESVTNVLKRGRKKSRSSNSSSSETAKSKKTACSEKAHNSSINQIDGTVDEHSDSSVKKMVRSKSKPSGSSVQNSEIQDASDRDIEGLTNLNSLNKSRRHGSSSNNTESRSSARQACKLKQTPTIGEDLLHAESSSDVSENNVDENVEEEDLPKIHGLNGDSIGHLAKDDLLNESDSSASQDVEATEDTQHIEDSEEENVISKRRKANAISSDSEGGTSRRKHEDDEEARVSDFEDSEDESSESAKRSKRKKKPSESDGSAGSSNEGKKKRRRIKQVNDSDGSGSDTENEGRNKHGRKNIRKVMGKNQLEEATKKAAREEKERIARIADRQKLYNNLDFDETGKPDEVVLEKVVLDFDPETKEPLIQVDRGLVKKLKPHQTVQHGFPHRASALAWDPLLRVVALGTATGALKVYGRPGVELYGQHTNSDSSVTQILFIPGTGRLVSLSDDNSLHLWEINEKSLVELKTYIFEGKNKKISALCVESTGKHLVIGTEGGNIYNLDLNTFAVTEDVIYQDVVMQNCPEDFKVNPGAVEAICEHPKVPSRLLVGYNRGLVVLWDRVAAAPTHTFVSNQQLESLCWNDDGEHFTSSHNDGSYVTWEVAGAASDRPLKEPVTPYGPYPCKAISKILTRTSVDGDEITIYAGGMPRASYSDKYTVTVQQGEKHVAFDFTSRVIDFFTTTPVPPDGVPLQEERPETPAQIQVQTVNQVAAALVVLAEEELVVIDLCDSRWRPIRLPYLVSIHASAVTTAQLVDNVASNVYENIVAAGQQQCDNMYSEGAWPISGGSAPLPEAGERQLLLTGHEDGSVRFWDVAAVPMTPLYKYTTAHLFSGEEIGENNDSQADEEEWPPFRRVGTFDPYSDDPRLAVKRVILCPLSGMLTIGGAAGHIVIASLKTSSNTAEVKSVTVNIVSDRDGFVWKGHDQLTLRSGSLTFPQGYQASSVVQLVPPAAVSALGAQWEWGLVVAGTAHGLALLDALRPAPLLHKCTLNPHDHSGAGDTPISRRKSFKKSLRESFRRLRKGRSQRRQTTTTSSPTSPTQPIPKKPADKAASDTDAELKPVERAVEARPADDGFGSMVRCLYFARTFLINTQNSTPTLWAGTNNGTVYAFTINVPNTNKRKDEPVTCQLAKEIQLKHRAPVIGITVLDGAAVPLPDPLEVERGVAALPEGGAHRVVITSEEQFKVFALPSLKPSNKYKLTAHEGARVRRTAFAWFECNTSEGSRHREWCLLCLTNLGDCLVLSPELRRQLNAAAVRKEDINGISSLCFSKRGEALYLHSSSELQRISLSATKVTIAQCHIILSPWAASLRGAFEEPPLTNGDHKEEVPEAAHDVTAASADITVDSVRDHTSAPEQPPELNINLQNSQVNTSSMVVKTTTRTMISDSNGDGTTTTTTTTSNSTTENILEHSREEGVITRIETGTVTVPAGTDPKLILEMFDRQRSPLSVPVPPPPAAAETN